MTKENTNGLRYNLRQKQKKRLYEEPLSEDDEDSKNEPSAYSSPGKVRGGYGRSPEFDSDFEFTNELNLGMIRSHLNSRFSLRLKNKKRKDFSIDSDSLFSKDEPEKTNRRSKRKIIGPKKFISEAKPIIRKKQKKKPHTETLQKWVSKIPSMEEEFNKNDKNGGGYIDLNTSS